jgi:hypothetical protein
VRVWHRFTFVVLFAPNSRWSSCAFQPYAPLQVDPRIFDPEKAKDPKDPDYGKARLLPSVSLDDSDEMEKILRRGEVEAKPQ